MESVRQRFPAGMNVNICSGTESQSFQLTRGKRELEWPRESCRPNESSLVGLRRLPRTLDNRRGYNHAASRGIFRGYIFQRIFVRTKFSFPISISSSRNGRSSTPVEDPEYFRSGARRRTYERKLTAFFSLERTPIDSSRRSL